MSGRVPDKSKKNDPTFPAPSLSQQAPTWTVEDWKNLVEAIRPLVQEFVQFKNQEFEYKVKRVGSVSTHNRRLTYSMLLFLLGIVALMSVLTWLARVSGDALLFLAGTITGYMIIMVQNLTYPLFEEEETPE